MATSKNDRTYCATCEKEKAIAKCAGCLRNFCLNHLREHRQQLTKEFDEIESSRNLFRQMLIQQINEPQNKWEHESIYKIRQMAEETKILVGTYINEHAIQLEEKLTKLTDQLQQSRQMDDIIETDLQIWKEELTRLTEQFNTPSHITIQPRPIPLINQLGVEIAGDRAHYASLLEGKKS